MDRSSTATKYRKITLLTYFVRILELSGLVENIALSQIILFRMNSKTKVFCFRTLNGLCSEFRLIAKIAYFSYADGFCNFSVTPWWFLNIKS